MIGKVRKIKTKKSPDKLPMAVGLPGACPVLCVPSLGIHRSPDPGLWPMGCMKGDCHN